MQTYNIYCDESCHLERDNSPVMVLGAVTCPEDKAREVADAIRTLKVKHRLSPLADVKWSKVSPSKHGFYQELINYFFDNEELSFRAIVVPDKKKLRHEEYEQTHDDFYYKMYFHMLKAVLDEECSYNIFLDIKDSRSAEKTSRLKDVLANNALDFERRIVRKIELVRSEHVQQIQLADILIGALTYVNRELDTSATKANLIAQIRGRSRLQLTRTTLVRARKVNLLVWQAG